jgi:Methyltransferase FkbM domain
LTNELNDEGNRVIFPSEKSIKVPIELLDEVENKMKNVALLKLDVEGFEKYVIEGAKSTLRKVECIYFEVSERNFSNFGYRILEVLKALEQSGFSLFKRKDGEEEISFISSDYIPLSPGYENLIGIKNILIIQNRTQWKVSSILDD